MKVEIVHIGNYMDGFQTFVRVDGKEFPDIYTYYEKKVKLVVVAGEKLAVHVLMGNDETVVLFPDEFDFEMGTTCRVTIAEDRFPCKITINGFEPRVKTLEIEFEEGVCPILNVGLMIEVEP